jgi:hypothetical protein
MDEKGRSGKERAGGMKPFLENQWVGRSYIKIIESGK